MKKIILMMSLGLILSGCATVDKTMTPISGSKSDGTVKMGYTYGEFQKVNVNMPETLREAKRKCRSWGYREAEAFGGAITTCNVSGGFGGCSSWQVTAEFQCLD